MMIDKIFEESKTDLTEWNQFLDEESEHQRYRLFLCSWFLIFPSGWLFERFPMNSLALVFVILLQIANCVHYFSFFAESVAISQQKIIIENHLSDKEIKTLTDKGIYLLMCLKKAYFRIIALFIVVILILFEKNFILTFFN